MASARLAQKGGLGAEPQRHTPWESPARNEKKGDETAIKEDAEN